MIRRVVADAMAGRLAEVHASAFDRPWAAKALAAEMVGAGAVTLAAEQGGEIAGFVLVRALAGEAEVLTLAVHPNARRQGWGRTLMNAAIKAATQAGAQVIWLEVAADNAPALALYAHVGFAPAGRRPAYYSRADGTRADAVVMRRALNTADV